MHHGKLLWEHVFWNQPERALNKPLKIKILFFPLLLCSSLGSYVCFTVLQRTDKTGTESHKDIHSESLNSTQVIWLSISQQCQNRETSHLLGKESKGMYMRMYFCAFFLPSSSIHLWLKRSIIPWKVSLTIVWLKEVIYVTVALLQLLVQIQHEIHSLTMYLDTQNQDMLCLFGTAASVHKITQLNQASVRARRWQPVCTMSSV